MRRGTRRAGEDHATRWQSTGDGTYTLAEAERDEVGTTIMLHLKSVDDEDGIADYTRAAAATGVWESRVGTGSCSS